MCIRDRGAGVAQSFAVAGYPVRLQDIAEAALTRGKGAIKKSLEPKVRDAALQRIAPTTRIDDFADCDVVVEAVLERFDVKKAVMENLDGVCRPETIRATNTSSISVTRRSPPKISGNVCSRWKPVRLSKHRRRMARNEALLVGRDGPNRNGRVVGADPEVAARIAIRIEDCADPSRTVHDLGPGHRVVLADSAGENQPIDAAQGRD